MFVARIQSEVRCGIGVVVSPSYEGGSLPCLWVRRTGFQAYGRHVDERQGTEWTGRASAMHRAYA